MSAIQQNRWDQLLRRAADLKGPGSKVNDALSELFPVFDVEHLPGELYKLAGIDVCFGGGQSTGAAATSGKLQLFNPAGSGKLLTVTSFHCSASAVTRVQYGIDLVALPAISTQLFRDTRSQVPELPTGVIGALAELALAPATMQYRLLANVTLLIEDSNGICVLSPGVGLTVGVAIQNITATVSFNWRERVAEPSELNL